MSQVSVQVTLSENDTQFCQLNQNTKSVYLILCLKHLYTNKKCTKKQLVVEFWFNWQNQESL